MYLFGFFIVVVYHYILQIFTGNKPNSGTNANIFINIFGEKGDCGERWLGHSVNRNSELFQQNQVSLKYL